MTVRLRVVIAGSDENGAAAVARALRDAGVEVVYTGSGQTAEQIAQTAIQEDADAVGVPDPGMIEKVATLLGADDVLLFATCGKAPDDITEWVLGKVE